MKRKSEKIFRAIHLRKKGESVKEIARTLDVSQSSVSSWVRNVPLSRDQRTALNHKGFTPTVISRRRQTRLKNESTKRREIVQKHKNIFPKKLTQRDLLFIGTCLYWGEGGKSEKNRIFSFTNSDPAMIRTMRVFIDKVLQIDQGKLRGHIHIHPTQSVRAAIKYWSNISGIPLTQFYKTTTTLSGRPGRTTKHSLPHGTFSIQICSVNEYLKMLAWIEVAGEQVDCFHSI